MKLIKILSILLLTGSACYAQRENFPPASVVTFRCGEPTIKKGMSPLYVVLHEDKEYELDWTIESKKILDPSKISAINVVKLPQSVIKYKEKGKNGVILINLNEERYPSAFQELEKHLTILKTEKDKE